MIVRRRVLASAMASMALAACAHGGPPPTDAAPPAPTPSTGAAPWPAPPDPLTLARRAGLVPTTHEFFTFHIHVHLDVFVNGRPMPVPGGIGININDPGVHHGPTAYGTGYGGISECAQPCISPLHTHEASGIIHVEAPTQETFRLGQFFTEWAVRLDSSCVGGYCRPRDAVAVFVDGKRWSGNPADIVFTNLREIAIVIGSPPATIPSPFPMTPSPIPS